MTISSKHFEFLLQGSMRLLTAKQWNIAQTPVHHADAPAQDIIPGDQFAIYADGDHSTYSVYAAEAWTNGAPQHRDA
ncbi:MULTISPECIES: hypothetical protein [unclassified Neorhizobium]|uniref:hypothetical protein n=1 Tax=unclassified Neorhizobium TaxID=2629175 RepID=UPI001FF1BA24|nr:MULTISPECIES: hypothetical protein [unclassified Neorhizobium]MCJ9674244.1 hypothetical protein [Neorhizobium sp. SHOUNA12B]MCJ9748941.1 hypothetical protein [Neorhizobium sp. SHOUNA12A]